MSPTVLSILPDDCLRLISSFIAPTNKTKLYHDLISLESNLESGDVICDAIINLFLCDNNLTRIQLYDIVVHYKRIPAYGWDVGIVATFETIRNCMEDMFRIDHSTRMMFVRNIIRSRRIKSTCRNRWCEKQYMMKLGSIHKEIRARRVKSTCCSRGCTQCGADLPLTWPSYSNGFCSVACGKSFNSSLTSAWSADDTHKKYSCGSCMKPVEWCDLENRNGRIFCCDDCEEIQIVYEDEMAKYDRKYDYRD